MLFHDFGNESDMNFKLLLHNFNEEKQKYFPGFNLMLADLVNMTNEGDQYRGDIKTFDISQENPLRFHKEELAECRDRPFSMVAFLALILPTFRLSGRQAVPTGKPVYVPESAAFAGESNHGVIFLYAGFRPRHIESFSPLRIQCVCAFWEAVLCSGKNRL